MLKRILKNEIKKAVCSKPFLFVMFLGFIIIAVECYFNGSRYAASLATYIRYKQETGFNSMYKTWGTWDSLNQFIFHEAAIDYQFSLILPLLVVIPGAWSFCSDWQSGYFNLIISKCGKRRYIFSKYTATFVSGFLLSAIFCIMSVLLAISIYPTYAPYTLYPAGTGLTAFKLLISLFLHHTFLYFVIIIAIYCLYGALFACLPLAVTLIDRSIAFCLLFPFGILLTAFYMEKFGILLFNDSNTGRLISISPLMFINQFDSPTSMPVYLGGIFVLFAISAVPLVWWTRKKDLL